jgi:predicted DNA-binding protein with PD1-like motif
MRASEGELGRVFILRLEDGDRLPDCLEAFAAKKGVSAGHVILVGGIGSGEVVVGPRRSMSADP